MIKLVQSGNYQLSETKGRTKMLTLDKDQGFAWVQAEGIGEILVSLAAPHTADRLLATGPYRMYQVEDEPRLADTVHLELMAGVGAWQGYLLLTGLPSGHKKRSRVVPTKELVSRP